MMELRLWRKERARSRMEMYLGILQAIRRERLAKPTHIMYRSNTSWAVLQPILGSLVENRLIEIVEEGGRKAYCLTDEGRKAIEIFEAACEIARKIEGGEC